MAKKSVKNKKRFAHRRLKLTRAERKWVSKKIRFLIVREGKSPKQAAGQAYGMLHQKRKEKRA